jgi:phosphatidylinositol alpha-1,6-mannosyltransferase
MLRVLVLTPDFPPAAGGIQQYVYQLCRHLPDIRWAVVAPDHPEAKPFDCQQSFPVFRSPNWTRHRRASFAAFCGLALAIGLRRRFDVILCGHVLGGVPALALRRVRGIPVVVMAHSQEIRTRRRRRLAERVLRQADLTVANSEFTRKTLTDLGVSPARIRKVNPPVSLPNASGPDDSAEARRRFGLGGEPLILTVSRLAERYKGHDAVIRVLPLIRSKAPGARLVLAGDGPLRGFYARLAKSLGVEEAVVFLGSVGGADLAALYAACDVFLMLSRESRIAGGAEGFGIAFLEAGLSGKPVVGGRSGGIPDAVQDEVTGLLVDPTDTQAIAEAVVNLLEQPDRARRLGENGRRLAMSQFAPARIADLFCEVLLEAAARRGD